MAASGFGDLALRFDALSQQLSGKPAKDRLVAVGKAVAPDIEKAIRADIGDLSMSGWRDKSGAAIALTGSFVVESDTRMAMVPAVKNGPPKRGRGPMRVLEQGRNQGNASGFAGPGVSADGTTKRTKSGGVRKVRSRQARRWNGRTQGKGTWTDATKIMAPHLVAAYWEELAKPVAHYVTGE